MRQSQCRSVEDAVILCCGLKADSKNTCKLERSKDFSEKVTKISNDKLPKQSLCLRKYRENLGKQSLYKERFSEEYWYEFFQLFFALWTPKCHFASNRTVLVTASQVYVQFLTYTTKAKYFTVDAKHFNSW